MVDLHMIYITEVVGAAQLDIRAQGRRLRGYHARSPLDSHPHG